ncbi:acetylornithine/succinyldiaminopimelate transaminase [Gammaproteobacteria bacterium]|jgi:acetylornithine/N-succinyldiaminopimelate aminotransferase|nr:acetylornithine/succinyldiaminopimelate transaminase [Gammaproteobacteria bacterium]|tara:strand:- start:220 stop:1425 length:1206 start_codon:yes stop_codon:yes gene_type:complete
MNDNTDKNKKLRDLYEQVMLPNYAPADFIPEKASGSSVWDKNNKKFIDFGGGIAVNSLGHSHPKLVSALNEQSKKLWHLSNYISNEPAINLAKQLTDLTFADKVYFSNSGSEANEAAIKMARRYHHEKGNGRDEIIAFNNSFHGRSLLNISLGASDNHRKGFGPFPAGIRHATYNDLSSVKALITAKTAAIIIEPVQGEAGVVPAKQEFLLGVRDLCTQNGVLLIMDEVQSGVGRMGNLFGYMAFGIEPDILTSAKGLGGGIPIGATLTKNDIASSMSVGSHGSTFGGNPMACAVADKVIEIVSNPNFLQEVKEKETLLVNKLEGVSKKHQAFREIRSSGLWIGCELNNNGEVNELLDRCYESGLIAVSAGTSTLRFAPALNISEDEISEGIERLEDALSS